MKACKDIDFLDSYWKEAKKIANDVKEVLPKGMGEEREPVFNKGGVKMYIVNFSDLKDTWSPKDIIYNVAGRSKTLEVLADKLCDMIYKGRAESIKPMIQAICNNNIKKLTKPVSKKNKKREFSNKAGEFLGYGHFRWNNQSHTLSSAEIKHLKNYFKL